MIVLSLVIPAYNEEQGIARVIERTLAQVPLILRHFGYGGEVELVVVNDGSTDRTAGIVSAFPGVSVITHPVNAGYRAALKTGFAHAQGEYVGFLDADGTYPPESLPDLCAAIVAGDADMAIGSRMVGRQGMPVLRWIGNVFFTGLLRWVSDAKLLDSASGMRIFRRKLIPHLSLLPDTFDFIVAMSTWALHEELAIVELEIPYDKRAGQSKLNIIGNGVRFFSTIFKTASLYNPLKVFGGVGLGLLVVAGLLGVYPVVHWVRERQVEDREIYRLVTIMVLLVTGLQAIHFGALSSSILSIMYRRDVTRRNRWAQLFLAQSARYGRIVGLLLIVAALALNTETIRQYFTTGHISVHWVYVLAGASLFLVGVQLILGSALLRILTEVGERKGYIEASRTDLAGLRTDR